MQHVVLLVFCRHVRFSTCLKQEPQQHLDVQGGCGCNLVGVGFQNVPVARVLGMSDLEMLLWLVFGTHRKSYMLIKKQAKLTHSNATRRFACVF